MSGIGNPYSNPDLGNRPASWQQRAPSPMAAAVEDAMRAGLPLPPGALGFIRYDRISYIAPPTTGQLFTLFTVGDDLTGGWITRIGIGSPQFDWFGTNEYFFALSESQPYEFLFGSTGGPSQSAGSSIAFGPIGTLRSPADVRIVIRSGQRWQLGIRPQSTPAAGTVVYNIVVRTDGFFYK